VTLLFLTGLFEHLPEATLAAIVIAALIELDDIAILIDLYRLSSGQLRRIYGVAARPDFIAAVAAMLGVLIFDTLPGLSSGIAVSLLLVGEASHQPQVAPDGPEVAGDTRRPPTEGQVAEPWRDQADVSARSTTPGGQPGWRMASLGLLAAALVLAGGLAVHAATRPGPSTRVGQST
jgi:MFS superfamily sulfate permease-like transporter